MPTVRKRVVPVLGNVKSEPNREAISQFRFQFKNQRFRFRFRFGTAGFPAIFYGFSRFQTAGFRWIFAVSARFHGFPTVFTVLVWNRPKPTVPARFRFVKFETGTGPWFKIWRFRFKKKVTVPVQNRNWRLRFRG